MMKHVDVPHSPIGSPHPKLFEFKSALEQTKQNPSGFAFSTTTTITNRKGIISKKLNCLLRLQILILKFIHVLKTN